MQKINNFLNAEITPAKTPDQITTALKNIRKTFKLDLKYVAKINEHLEFIYKIENIDYKVYIIATAKKTPRKWVKLSYIIL